MKPRFLLDEHVEHAIQRQLRRLEPAIDVLAIGELGAPAKETPDEELLAWTAEYGYILLTENRSTMPVHLQAHLKADRHFPSILYLRPRAPLGQIIEDLYLIWAASTADEYEDRTLFIPL